jgi:salicylate hydroxylase
MAAEDAAVLSEIFCHLECPDQIEKFLYAFQDLRKERYAEVLEEEIHNIEVMAMPPGEQQKARDEALRRRRDAGLDAYDISSSPTALDFHDSDRMYTYEAEENADHWYEEWDGGRDLGLRKSGGSTPSVLNVVVGSVQTVEVSTADALGHYRVTA